MRPRNVFRICIAGACILFLMQPSASFGYVEADTAKEVGYGGEATFTAYLMAEDGVIQLDSVEHPAGWTVSVTPEAVEFPFTGERYKYVQEGDTYRKLVPVRVAVDVPTDVEEGTYTVRPVFRKRVEDDEAGNGSQVAFRQVQEFDFSVDVAGPRSDDGEEEQGLLDEAALTIRGAVDRVLGDEETGEGSDDTSEQQVDEERDTGRDDGDDDLDAGQQDSDRAEDDGLEQGSDTPTGFVSRHGSTIVQGIIFIAIWAMVGGYLWRRRRKDGSEDARPWADSVA